MASTHSADATTPDPTVSTADESPTGVKDSLTASRPARPARHQSPRRATRRRSQPVENDSFTKFCRRIIAAAGRRVADGDVESLPDLLTISQEADRALTTAVVGLREFG